jgi:hypothetical protein
MEATPHTEGSLEPTPIAELRRVYLERLDRLQRLRLRHEQELNGQGVRLLNRSIFEAYCMCREIGAEDEARAIIDRYLTETAA